MNRHQVGVAAEAFAAGIFAQASCSVFVQYGANQPGFDLAVTKNGKTISVSVKGSSNGYWLLCPPLKDKRTKAQALENWIRKNQDYVFCFVNFKDCNIGQMPRLFLATGREVAKELKQHEYGEPAHYLCDYYVPKRGKNKGKQMGILTKRWEMTEDRITKVLEKATELWTLPGDGTEDIQELQIGLDACPNSIELR